MVTIMMMTTTTIIIVMIINKHKFKTSDHNETSVGRS